MSIDIASPANEKIKRLIRLRDRKHRDAEGVFVVEGRRLIERALETGLTALEVYVTPAIRPPPADSKFVVAPEVLGHASYRKRSPGILAVFAQFETDLDRLDAGRQTLVLAAEGIEKPGNLGAMLRVADAAGADAFISVGESVDPFNPNVLRASTGALFSVPFARADCESFLTWLGVPLVVATPDTGRSPWDVDMASGIGLLVGSEDSGVTPCAKGGATTLVSLPMAGVADSLNASVTLALLAFEAVRQRQNPNR